MQIVLLVEDVFGLQDLPLGHSVLDFFTLQVDHHQSDIFYSFSHRESQLNQLHYLSAGTCCCACSECCVPMLHSSDVRWCSNRGSNLRHNRKETSQVLPLLYFVFLMLLPANFMSDACMYSYICDCYVGRVQICKLCCHSSLCTKLKIIIQCVCVFVSERERERERPRERRVCVCMRACMHGKKRQCIYVHERDLLCVCMCVCVRMHVCVLERLCAYLRLCECNKPSVVTLAREWEIVCVCETLCVQQTISRYFDGCYSPYH